MDIISRKSHRISIRQPLGDATQRFNKPESKSNEYDLAREHREHGNYLRSDGLPQKITSSIKSSNFNTEISTSDKSKLEDFSRPQSKEKAEKNRESILSTESTNSGGKLKSCVGPWKLGKTLGKGSTARVRLARHVRTGQEVAVKIVPKASAQITQSGSLANFERAESRFNDENEKFKRMPAGIEREVAIMKLIQHPNILKLYDIWENRREIYLCLEYIDNGELFEKISHGSGLPEEEAMRYFRQILSAVGYCHSFNICHRDLKPENILLTSDGQIKIADFGMAALHQTPSHRLSTSCGSPHYAAPELIRGLKYRGNKVDIWSMGVILYATLSGKLPFDVEGSSKKWLPPLLLKIEKGQYEMVDHFSPEVKDLIGKMLQVNPKDRITLSQIWRHPLLVKYDYLDDLGREAYSISPSIKDCGLVVLQKADINMEIFRHLRSMWHKLSEQKLMAALLSEKPNDQKLFYVLLEKFREEQLENYMPDIGYSSSDHHHVKPLSLTKNFSTCRFPRSKTARGHQRQISRLTVISNAAETIQSYDPFKASRPRKFNGRCDEAKITVYHDVSSPRENKSHSNECKAHQALQGPRSSHSIGQKNGVSRKIYVSQSSLASSIRSQRSVRGIRAPVGKRRGVSFSHLRGNRICEIEPHSRNSTMIFSEEQNFHPGFIHQNDLLSRVPKVPNAHIQSKKKIPLKTTQPLVGAKENRPTQVLDEDVRVQSLSLAKDCDEAFNCSRNELQGIELESDWQTAKNENKNKIFTEISDRPLPQPPVRTESVKVELIEARRQAELRKKIGRNESSTYLERLVTHIDKLMLPWVNSNLNNDRRATSAPIDIENRDPKLQLLSISKTGTTDTSPKLGTDFLSSWGQNLAKVKGERATSAPEPCMGYDFLFPHTEMYKKNTIKTIKPVSPGNLIKIQDALSIGRERSQREFSKPKAPRNDCGPGKSKSRENDAGKQEDFSHVDSHIDNSTPQSRKKANWFRRASKEDNSSFFEKESSKIYDSNIENRSLNCKANRPQPDLSHSIAEPKKKNGFMLKKLFEKQTQKSNMTLSNDHDDYDDDSILRDSIICSNGAYDKKSMSDVDGKFRQIAPLRNWFAKLFTVKPTARFICFSTLKKVARRETVALLREWRCYGIQDIKVDPRKNVIFGKVADNNYFHMKGVKFAAEFMTVIEHGKSSTLSISRWTQKEGAASSFQKLIQTLEVFLKIRNLLVADERKRKLVIKTVKSLAIENP